MPSLDWERKHGVCTAPNLKRSSSKDASSVEGGVGTGAGSERDD